MKRTVKNRFSEALGACSLALLFFMLLLSGCSFLLQLHINSAILPSSYILALCVTYAFFARGKAFLLASLTTLLTLIGSAIVCSLIYDNSYDTYGYHYNVVVMLVKGWNPVDSLPWDGSLWSQHYAKGLEMMQAAILAFTGNLQSTKCVNFIFVLAAASLAWSAIGKVFPTVSRLWKTTIVIMLVSNPVVICQLTTSYNDYALWVEMVIMTCALLLIWENSKTISPYLLLSMVFVIGINTKFTHFYYLGMECLFFAAWCLCTKKYFIILWGAVTVISAVLVGTLLVGYNPYVSNTAGYGNPFYPLLGGSVDIMSQ